MVIKRIVETGERTNRVVIELPDGRYMYFRPIPARKIEEKDLKLLPYYNGKYRKSATGTYVAYLYKFYGLEKEKKSTNINMKTKPSVKQMAEKLAEKNGKTVSSYIESLIKKEYEQQEMKEMKKFLMVYEIVGGDSWTEVYETQKEANTAAELKWNSLSRFEKKRAHVFVMDVTAEDLDPDAIQEYEENGGEFPWTSWVQGGHVDGNFDSEKTDLSVKASSGKIEIYLRGKTTTINTVGRLMKDDSETDLLQEWIESDIAEVENTLGDTLRFNEKDELYKELIAYYDI